MTSVAVHSPTARTGRRSTRRPAAVAQHPKEHGAYAILAVPVVTSLLITGPTVVGLCIAVAAVAGFMAHEPVLITLGHRGNRARRDASTAPRRLALLLSSMIGFGSLALWLGSGTTRLALTECLLFAVTSFALAIAGKHRTLYGQAWGVAGLSVTCVPILLAGGFAINDAMEIWVAFLVGFLATTLAVRSVIAAQKRKPRGVYWMAIAALSAAALSWSWGTASPLRATLPMIALSWILLARPPAAKRLRQVGWTLVGGTVATAVWIAGLHW